MKLYAVLDDGILVSRLFRTHEAAVNYIVEDYEKYKQASAELLIEIRENLEAEWYTGDWEIVEVWFGEE